MSTKHPRNKVVSCAECRRLKLRCDRQFPCHNCVKRGLSAICPDGSLPTRPKVLMEEAERLTKKNAELTDRIRMLEEALEAAHGSSDEIHPLLVKREVDDAETALNGNPGDKDIEEVNDSLGTLTIDQDGRSIFLGNTAGMESIFRERPVLENASVPAPNLLHSLGIFSSLHDSKEAVLGQIEMYLPPAPIAHLLVDVYYEHGAWLYNPITRDRLFDQVFNLVYSSNKSDGGLSRISSHNAALLFMVFALGSFLSPDFDEDAGEQYHQLARTALSCDAILVDPTIAGIRTLLMMAYYHILRDKNAPQHCWALMGLASHMAQNIGLHRDSRRWKLDDSTVQERRGLFWEMYYMCMNQSISFGRPPSLSLDYCDCDMPRAEDRPEHRAGEFKPSFHTRKLQFAAECLSQVARATLGVKSIAYSTILALDRKIRDSHALKIPCNGASGQNELGAATVSLTFQRFMLKAHGEMALLYLHRRFFARAVTNYPTDILHCPFGPSVLAIYRSASSYISLMRDLCSLQPELPSRFVIFWNNLLASSIIMASIATKCPASVLAPSAITELDTCFTLFETTARFGGSSSRPARALNIVSKIRDRAHKVATDFQAGLIPSEVSRKTDTNDINDELTILSGRARLVATNSARNSEEPSPGPSGSNPATPPVPPQPNLEAYRAAHPALLAHLREATKSPQLMAPVSWESMNVQPQQAQAVSRQATQGEDPFNIPLDMDPNMMHQGYTQEHDSVSLSPPWDTPPSAPAHPDEMMGNTGMSIAWDADWQAYMRQFGMPYVEGEPPGQ
ncbi:hypothetical protein M422DRAFT_24494 [Sphaerobolus stellatus SS14]|nr:hypothetical protein M422DRAFT_24494 [Sphaerobolus stellatus SS14]